MQGSLNAYAKHRKTKGLAGGSLQAVQKAMTAGRITVVKTGAGYSVDFEAADAQWAANTHPTQGRDAATHKPPRQQAGTPNQQPNFGQRSPTPLGGDTLRPPGASSDEAINQTAVKFNIGRAAKMAYEAAQAELNYKARLGELVERAKEESRARSLAQEVKDAILGIPDRIAPLLAAESDALRVHIMLTDELIIALERLSCG